MQAESLQMEATALNSTKEDIQKTVGDELEEKLMGMVSQEGIEIEKSFDYSIKKTAAIALDYKQDDTLIKKTIILPMFTDDNGLKRAIVIAHELGHYFVMKNLAKWKRELLNDPNKAIVYVNELLAWKKARSLLIELNFWKHDEVRFAFNQKKKKSLQSYKPNGSWTSHIFFSFCRPILFVAKLWLLSYFLVSAYDILTQNNVPIPFLSGTPLNYTSNEFFASVNGIFLTFALVCLSYFIIKKLLVVKDYS